MTPTRAAVDAEGRKASEWDDLQLVRALVHDLRHSGGKLANASDPKPRVAGRAAGELAVLALNAADCISYLTVTILALGEEREKYKAALLDELAPPPLPSAEGGRGGAQQPTPSERLAKQGPHRAPEGHTAGPWAARMQFGDWFVRQDPENFAGMGYQHVCSLAASRKGSYYGDMFAANARLIAAAPDLLDALRELHLKAVIGTDEERHTALNNAWAAITKATSAYDGEAAKP